MIQYDLDAYSVAALGLDAVMAAIQEHKVERYGTWAVRGPSGRTLSYMPWIWYQGLSIAAQEAAERAWGRRAGASTAERRDSNLRFGTAR